jgi:hypothetical protein
MIREATQNRPRERNPDTGDMMKGAQKSLGVLPRERTTTARAMRFISLTGEGIRTMSPMEA